MKIMFQRKRQKRENQWNSRKLKHAQKRFSFLEFHLFSRFCRFRWNIISWFISFRVFKLKRKQAMKSVSTEMEKHAKTSENPENWNTRKPVKIQKTETPLRNWFQYWNTIFGRVSVFQKPRAGSERQLCSGSSAICLGYITLESALPLL